MALFQKPAGLQMLRRFVIFLSEKQGIDPEKGVPLVPQTKWKPSKARLQAFQNDLEQLERFLKNPGTSIL